MRFIKNWWFNIKTILFGVLLSFCFHANAQYEGSMVLYPPYIYTHGMYDTTWYYSHSLDTFQGIQEYPFFKNQNMSHGVINLICDSTGKLLLFSNGIFLFNDSTVIDSGYLGGYYNDTIGNYLHNYKPFGISSGYNCYFLPNPDSNYYYFITQRHSLLPNYEGLFAYSIIDSNHKVPKKNIILRYNPWSRLLACIRHSNGRDWWIINHSEIGDTFFLYLTYKDSIHFIRSYNLGFSINKEKAYFTLNFNSNLLFLSIKGNGSSNNIYELYQFNRQNGILNYHKDFSSYLHPKSPDPETILSKNGKILYFAIRDTIIQMDINSLDTHKIVLSIPNDSILYEPILARFDQQIVVWLIANFRNPMNHPWTFTRPYHLDKIALIDSSDWFNLGALNYRANYLNRNIHISMISSVSPNYRLGPILEPGFELIYDTLSCGSAQITVKDTSCCHFYRVWDWGDGTTSDTLAVPQHQDIFHLTDTFQIQSHTYSQPGIYKIKLYILNPYTPRKLPQGYFLKDSIEKIIIVPDCIFPALFISHDTLCRWDSLKVSYNGTMNYDSLWFYAINAFGDTTMYLLSSPNSYLQFPEPGFYSCFLRAKNLTFDTTWVYPYSITVTNCIKPNLNASQHTLCEYDKLYLNYTGTNNYDSLQLIFQNIQTQQSFTFPYQNVLQNLPFGTYELKIRAQNPEFDTVWVYPNFISFENCVHLDLEITQNPICIFDSLLIHYSGSPNYDTLKVSTWNESILKVFEQVYTDTISQIYVKFTEKGNHEIQILWSKNGYDTLWGYGQKIEVLPCDGLWIPSGFTPNSDGINDEMVVVCPSCEWIKLELYNRDAQPISIHEGTSSVSWNGKWKGEYVPQGVYVYRVTAYKIGGKTEMRYGTVTVIR